MKKREKTSPSKLIKIKIEVTKVKDTYIKFRNCAFEFLPLGQSLDPWV